MKAVKQLIISSFILSGVAMSAGCSSPEASAEGKEKLQTLSVETLVAKKDQNAEYRDELFRRGILLLEVSKMSGQLVSVENCLSATGVVTGCVQKLDLKDYLRLTDQQLKSVAESLLTSRSYPDLECYGKHGRENHSRCMKAGAKYWQSLRDTQSISRHEQLFLSKQIAERAKEYLGELDYRW